MNDAGTSTVELSMREKRGINKDRSDRNKAEAGDPVNDIQRCYPRAIISNLKMRNNH
jgi:hypothetical protein